MRQSTIKSTFRSQKTIGAVDLHVHGAFGIDLMSAAKADFVELSYQLWKQGVAGFCPTTLSSPFEELLQSVQRLGQWIQQGPFPGAKPLGIHLEGPYINALSCGAHPPETIRDLNWLELDRLWQASQGSLKILTIAPEKLSILDLRRLVKWASDKKIHLSVGHSQATEAEAEKAFQEGFQGVTHTWNAMSFHHRSPGILGAALGRKNVYLELIIDQVHVSPSLIRWTLNLHPTRQICFISDCLSAGGSRNSGDACRLPNGQLAGGSLLLTQAYCKWIQREAKAKGLPLSRLLKTTLPFITVIPLKTLKLNPRLLMDRQVQWSIVDPNNIRVTHVSGNSN